MFTYFPVDRVSHLLTFCFRGGIFGVLTDCKYDGWSTVLSCSCETVTGIMFVILSGELSGKTCFRVERQSLGWVQLGSAKITAWRLVICNGD